MLRRKSPGFRFVVTLILEVFTATAVQAGVNHWTPVGPVGPPRTDSFITDVLIDRIHPSIIYAAADIYAQPVPYATIFKSTNGGDTWVEMNSGLPGLSIQGIRALAIDPIATTTLYASTDRGVFKTTDGGTTWMATNEGLTNQRVSIFAIDPTMTSTVYAGTDTGSIFKSTNSGMSWTKQSNGLTDGYIFALAIDPTSPQTLYAGSNVRIFKTVNGGNTWSAVYAPPGAGVGTLAVDPRSPAIVYAGIFVHTPGFEGTPCFGSAVKTTDGGMTWLPLNGGLPNYCRTFVIDPASPSTVYAGMAGPSISGLSGVFRSTDGGMTWTPRNNGLTNTSVSTLTIDPGSPATMYAGTNGGGIFKATFDDSVSTCSSGPTALCLGGGRFQIQASWRAPDGTSGSGQAVPMTADAGSFWFFSSNNVELVVKVVDGRAFNNRFWVFSGALSNIQYTVTVTDTLTGAVKTYFNSQGQLTSFADTAAF